MKDEEHIVLSPSEYWTIYVPSNKNFFDKINFLKKYRNCNNKVGFRIQEVKSPKIYSLDILSFVDVKLSLGYCEDNPASINGVCLKKDVAEFYSLPKSSVVNICVVLNADKLVKNIGEDKALQYEIIIEAIDETTSVIDEYKIQLELDFRTHNSITSTKVEDVVAWIDLHNDNIIFDPLQTHQKIGDLCINVSFEGEQDVISNFQGTVSVSLNDVGCSSNVIEIDDTSSSSQFSRTNVKCKPKNVNGQTVPTLILPLFINQSVLTDLREKDTRLCITPRGRYSLAEESDIFLDAVSEPEFLTIHREIQKSQLTLSYVKDGEKEVVDIASNRRAPVQIRLPKLEFSPCGSFMSNFELSLANKATEMVCPGAGIMIRYLSENEEGTETFNLRTPEDTLIESVLQFSASSAEAFLEDGKNQTLVMSLVFDPSTINSVDNHFQEFVVRTVISVAYWENFAGDPLELFDGQKRYLTVVVEWPMRMLPHAKRLCIDYGSSAIACKFGNELLALRKKKREVFHDDVFLTRFAEDSSESNDYFINSEALLLNVGAASATVQSSLRSQQVFPERNAYSASAVCLSPSSTLLTSRYQFQLPCLKLLVGNEFLPLIDFYKTFRYNASLVKGTVEEVASGEIMAHAQSLMRVDTVFNECYRALFLYFVKPLVGNIRNINRLVLTYPNTYSPAHLERLSDIAHQVFPNLMNLRFIGESDAVAAYYVRHWSAYHQSIRDIRRDEYVLVYDMGAGTLDITYFMKKYSHDNHRFEVEIMGKIGTGKAGNYLDNVLATIICSLNGIDPRVASILQRGDAMVVSQRVALKQFICQQLKPALSEPSNCTLSFSLGSSRQYAIGTQQILQHQDFLKYLEDVTSEVLTNMWAYIERRRPRIDTVIFSGRSCKLVPLQKKIKLAITSSCRPMEEDREREFIYLNSPVSHQKGMGFSDADLQKTVVVEGAEIMASSEDVYYSTRRLYANYGLAYQKTGGGWHYTELLSHQCMPSSDSKADYKSEKKILNDLSAASELVLLQSYFPADRTAQCYESGGMDMVNEMQHFNIEEFKPVSQLAVQLILDQYNNISLRINDRLSHGTAPKGVNMQSEVIKRSIWPVVY